MNDICSENVTGCTLELFAIRSYFMAHEKYPNTLASTHDGKAECPLAFEYVEDIYGDG